MKKLVTLVFLLAAVLLPSCGDDKPSLTAEEIAYLRAKRMQELYGTSSTVTSTASTTVTITSVNYTTVTSTGSVVY